MWNPPSTFDGEFVIGLSLVILQEKKTYNIG